MKMRNALRGELPQLLILIVPFVLCALWWDKFPARVATHWGIDGRPNGWMAKAPGLLLLPTINVAFAALLAWLPTLDPRMRQNPAAATARHRRVLRLARYVATGFLGALSLASIATAAGWVVNISSLSYFGTLLVLLVLGNSFSRLEPNFVIGIRTPWTLKNAETWRLTHRLCGRVMVLGAAVLLVAGYFLTPVVQMKVFLGFVLSLAAFAFAYSAWVYRRVNA